MEKTISNDILVPATILALIAANHVISITSLVHYGIIDVRYLIPTLPLYAILFAYGFLNINRKALKKIVLISFLFLGAYSFAYTAYTSLYFADIYENHYPMYGFIRALPSGANVVAYSQGRQVQFYGERLQDSLVCQNRMEPSEEFNDCLEENNINHVAVSCYSESEVFLERVEDLRQQNRLTEIFSDECNTVYGLI